MMLTVQLYVQFDFPGTRKTLFSLLVLYKCDRWFFFSYASEVGKCITCIYILPELPLKPPGSCLGLEENMGGNEVYLFHFY